MLTFLSFTTVYDVEEDRIRLTGVSAAGDVSCLWVTQRLMNRLIQRLCAALEANVPSRSVSNQDQAAAAKSARPLEQEFVQRRAQLAMRPASAVSPPPGLDVVLVVAVQFRIAKTGIVVRFNDAQDSPLAEMNLRVTQLRQWLSILHRLYRLANWPTEPWPAWFALAQAETGRPPAVSVH